MELFLLHVFGVPRIVERNGDHVWVLRKRPLIMARGFSAHSSVVFNAPDVFNAPESPESIKSPAIPLPKNWLIL